jgi:hypothetical protein
MDLLMNPTCGKTELALKRKGELRNPETHIYW